MPEADIAFRRLVRDNPEGLLRVAFPGRDLPVIGPLDSASTDRPRLQLSDNLFRVHDGEREVAVHVEIYTEWRPPIAKRMFDYASAAHTASDLPVLSVVVLLRPGGAVPDSPATYALRALGAERLRFSYEVVQLHRLDAREMEARLPPDCWAYLPAMRGADARYVEDLVQRLHAHPDLAPGRRDATLALLFGISAVTLGAPIARRVFEMDDIIQSPEFQTFVREWKEQGLQEGLQEGLQQGLQRGRQEALRAALAALVQARLGSLPQALAERIAACSDPNRLAAWIVAAGQAREPAGVLAALSSDNGA